jgi:DNA-binding PadR family transcriptional regulator
MNTHWNCESRAHRGGGRPGFLRRFGAFMGGGHGFRAARMLGSDDLQLIILALLNEKPRDGYEIIKALEEHSSGIYTPSPGVVYPALTYLEEVQFAVSEAGGNKKLYSITDAGKEHLAKNRDTADEMLAQLSRFGRKMARVQKHFADEEAENEFDESDPRSGEEQDWRRMRWEFREIKRELKTALLDKIDASAEEKKRILEILKNALAEIRKK